MSDSSTPVWPASLPLPAVARTLQHRSQSILSQMDSGRIRCRPVQTVTFQVMGVTWNFTDSAYETFLDFFERSLEQGSLSFLIELPDPLGSTDVETEVAFWECSFNVARDGNLFQVSAQLELVPESPSPVVYEDICFLPDAVGHTGSCDTIQAYTVGARPVSVVGEVGLWYVDPANSLCWDSDIQCVNLPPFGGMDSLAASSLGSWSSDQVILSGEEQWGLEGEYAFDDTGEVYLFVI